MRTTLNGSRGRHGGGSSRSGWNNSGGRGGGGRQKLKVRRGRKGLDWSCRQEEGRSRAP